MEIIGYHKTVQTEADIPEGWTLSENKPGYYTKTVMFGTTKIIINRPFLTPEEERRRHAALMRAATALLFSESGSTATTQAAG